MPPVINVNFSNITADADRKAMVTSTPPYTLRFHNRSGKTWTFVCYQPPPGKSEFALAWFAMPIANGVEVNFSWQQTYDLVWIETGELAAGVEFGASQVAPAAAGNLAKLTYADGAFAFSSQDSGPAGLLQIACDGTIPQKTVSVGIGMSGSPTLVTQAIANTTFSFTPFINYWVTAVSKVDQGGVIISEELKGAQVVFPPNVTAMTATLQTDGSWSIAQGLVV